MVRMGRRSYGSLMVNTYTRGTRATALAPALLLVVLLSVIACTLVTAPSALAGAYSHDSGAQVTNTDWMSALPDGRRLKDLSIPGTHDSGSYQSGGDIGLTQSMSIDEQLRSGIRGFDIRLGQNIRVPIGGVTYTFCPGPDLWVVHGTVSCQNQRFDTVLDSMTRFLASHPREVLLMNVQQDTVEPADRAVFWSKVQASLDRTGPVFYRKRDGDPQAVELTLGRTRGKIVLIRDSGTLDGIPWSAFDTQNNWSQPDNWHLADKWWAAAGKLNESGNPLNNKFYMNFLSASGGGFPYFFASGKSSPGTNAPALWTGLSRGTINSCSGNSRCIYEYPCVDVWGICYVNFRGMNYLTTDYLNGRPQIKRTGLVFADFPGGDLIQAILAVNRRMG